MGDDQKSFWNSVSEKASGLGKSIGHKASETGKNLTQKAAETAKKKASEMSEAIGNNADEAKKKVMETANASVESAKKQTQNWVDNIYSESEEIGESTPLHDWSLDELYHIFVRSQTATFGGTQSVTLKTGKSYTVKIPANPAEGTNLRLKGCGLDGEDAFLVLHTLSNPLFNIDRKINNLIVQAAIYDRTKVRCLEAYNRLIGALPIEDFAALNLLDYLVFSSKIYSEVGQCYTIASQNSRLLGIEDYLQDCLKFSRLSTEEKREITSVYQYLRSGEATPNFKALDRLDGMVLYSPLKPELKRYYLRASAAARLMTLDWIVVNEIDINQQIVQADRPRFLAVYQQLRDEKEVVDLRTLEAFDAWVNKAGLPEMFWAAYQLVRRREFELSNEFDLEDCGDSFGAIGAVYQEIKSSENVKTLSNNYPGNLREIKPGMLVEIAYNSVSRGGLGLLGGMPIIKNSKTWIETLARLAIARASEMNDLEKIKLGISQAKNRGTANPAAGENWQAVSPLGSHEQGISQLSGLDAYRAILIEIEGVTGLTEGANDRSDAGGLNVWKLLRGNSDRQRTLEELERQLYS